MEDNYVTGSVMALSDDEETPLGIAPSNEGLLLDLPTPFEQLAPAGNYYPGQEPTRPPPSPPSPPPPPSHNLMHMKCMRCHCIIHACCFDVLSGGEVPPETLWLEPASYPVSAQTLAWPLPPQDALQ